MAIEIVNANANIPSGSDIQSFACQLIGDGTTTTFDLNLSKAPFDFKFSKNPDSIDLIIEGVDGLPDISGALSQNTNGDLIVSCTLTSPLDLQTGHVEDMFQVVWTGTFIYNA